MRTLTRLMSALLLASLLSHAAAQSRSDLLILESTGNILRFPPVGSATTVATVPTTGLTFGMTMDVGNQDVVVSVNEAGNGRLVRVNLASGIQTTIISGLGPMWEITVDQNGDYIAADFSNMMRISRDGSTLTTLFPVQFGSDQVQDLRNGDWIISGTSTSGLDRYEYDHSQFKSAFGSSVAWALGRDPHRPILYNAAVVGVYAVDLQNGSTLRTLEPSTNPGPGGNYKAIAVDRAPDGSGTLIYPTTATVATSSDIFALDRAGMNFGTIYSTPNAKTASMLFHNERNLSAQLNNAPNDRFLLVNFPASALKPFVVALSLTGFNPNVTLLDGRILPITPDPLTALTAAGSIPPLFTGNSGLLDAGGSGQARLNVNSLGASVSGVRVWAVAVSLDQSNPAGIGEISAPIVIVL